MAPWYTKAPEAGVAGTTTGTDLADGDQQRYPSITHSASDTVKQQSVTSTQSVRSTIRRVAAGGDDGFWPPEALDHVHEPAPSIDYPLDIGDVRWIIEVHRGGLVSSIEEKKPWTLPFLSSLQNPGAAETPSEAKDVEASRPEDRASDTDESEWQRPEPRDQSFRINLVELQRMHLRKLQCRLVRHALSMRDSLDESKGWEEDLQAYTKAYQDYEYMIQCSRLPQDPFYITGERKTDAYVINQTMEQMGLTPESIVQCGGSNGAAIPVRGPWSEAWEPIGGTRDVNIIRARKARLPAKISVAGIAGIFLIGPMWLMMLRNRLYTTLLSATIFILCFGVLMAWKFDTPKDVMSNTAAYAAVLTVFVGLTVNNGNGSMAGGDGSPW